MDALDKLRSRNRFEEELPSGLKVTLRLPRIRDCILAGGVPLPVLNHLMKDEANLDDVSMEDAAHMARFQDQIVLRSVVAIEGEPVTLSTDDLPEFSQKDYDHIVRIGIRQSPLAATPTT